MNINKFHITAFLSLFLLVVQSQTAEYNKTNNWIHSGTQKYVGMDFINTSAGKLMNNGSVWFGGNFTNDGTVTYVKILAQNPALTLFSGNSTQHISGVGTTRFYKLFWGSNLVSGAFSLEQEISVAHEANFVKGIITAYQPTPESMTNMLLMEHGSSVNNASDISYVDGFVCKTGNSAFTFPVGNSGYYRPVSISAPSTSTDCFAARYIFNNPEAAGYVRMKKAEIVTRISNKEYWIVNRTKGTSNVALTLSWDVTKTSATIPENINKVKIVRWDGTKWVFENSLSVTGNSTKGTVTANVTGYGVFTLAIQSIASVGVNDSVSAWEDTILTGNVFGNDSVFLGNTLALTGFKINGTDYQPGTTATIPNKGAVTISADGTYTFSPVLNYNGSVPTVTYSGIDTDNSVIAANLDINVRPLPEITKTTSNPVMNNDGTFSWMYTISLFNDTQATIDSIQVEDNLDDVFKPKGCSYNVIRIVASGGLTANGLYNGSSIIKTLIDGQSFVANARDSIQIEVKVNTLGQSGDLSLFNQAVLNGNTIINGATAYIKDLKSNGTIHSSIPDSTLTVVPEIHLFIPDGFSPNGDGINDKLYITHTKATKIDLEVYNRWGVLVYKSADYQNDWDGTGTESFIGKELASGTYYCVYKEIKIDTNEVLNKYVKYITLRR